MNKKIIVEVISLTYILLFIYAGASKLLDYERMHRQLGMTPWLTSVSGLIAWAVPAIEILVSLTLIIPRWRLQALYACLILMVLFELYIISILKFSPANFIPCTCGGLLQQMSWHTHIIFNLAFILLALIGIRFEKQLRERNDDTSFNFHEYRFK